MPQRPKGGGGGEEDGTAAGVPGPASLPTAAIDPNIPSSTLHDVGFSSRTFVSVPATAISSLTSTARLDPN